MSADDREYPGWLAFLISAVLVGAAVAAIVTAVVLKGWV